jgi:lambda repressor-like predicted transcriptional regulator
VSRIRTLDLRSVIPVEESGVFVERAASTLGVSRRSAERWLVNGVNWHRADAIAVRVLGTHPINVWGSDWVEAADHGSRRATDDLVTTDLKGTT